MATLNDQLFNYLTQVQNYKSSKEIASAIVDVDERLRGEFWKDCVYQQLKEKEKQDIDKKFQLPPPYSNKNYSALIITKESWENLHVCYAYDGLWEQAGSGIYYGISLDNSKYNSQIVKSILNEYPHLLKDLNEDYPNWPCYQYIEYDFSKYETLLKILPDGRESFAKELADSLWKFVEQVECICEKISQIK